MSVIKGKEEKENYMKRQEQKLWIVNFVSVLAILGVFAIGSLVLCNVGIRVYKNIVVNNNENFKQRTSLLYVATKLRQYDQKDFISMKEIDGINVLVLQEPVNTEYETYIYFQDGAIKELLTEKANPSELSAGLNVVEVQNFHMSMVGENQIELCSIDAEGNEEKLTITLRAG